MKMKGFIIHHSICPTINGKGFDFYICYDGSIIPAKETMKEPYIHICLEGNFGNYAIKAKKWPLMHQEQLFAAQKLMIALAALYRFNPDEVFSHTDSCPGATFPWKELVISEKDGYH